MGEGSVTQVESRSMDNRIKWVNHWDMDPVQVLLANQAQEVVVDSPTGWLPKEATCLALHLLSRFKLPHNSVEEPILLTQASSSLDQYLNSEVLVVETPLAVLEVLAWQLPMTPMLTLPLI